MELALRQIKAEWPQTSALLWPTISPAGLAQAAGADGVLLKGFATETLFTTIDEVLVRIDRPSGQRSAE